MDKKHKELKKHIKKANNILIISHLGPDPDAFCSMLLLKEALKQVYPNKNIKVKTKQMPDFSIPTMKDLEIVERLDQGNEDLIIITDIPALSICTDKEDSLKDTTVPIMIIDHHPDGKQSNLDISINEFRSSATEQVYVTMKRLFGRKLRITKEMAEIAQYGIVADTNRFMYENTTPDTLRIFAELMGISEIDMENFCYNSQKFPRESIPFLIEFLKNIKIDGDMAYTFSENTDEESRTALNEAVRFFVDNILRYIQGVHWGFLVKSKKTKRLWGIGFRGTKGYQTVKKFAEELDGGGHGLAAGAEVKADTAEEAIEKVLQVVNRLKD